MKRKSTRKEKDPRIELYRRINDFDRKAPPELRGYYTMRGICLGYVNLLHNEDDKGVIFRAFNSFAQNCVTGFNQEGYDMMRYCFLELLHSFKFIDPQMISDKTLNALKDEPRLFEFYLPFFSDVIIQTEIERAGYVGV